MFLYKISFNFIHGSPAEQRILWEQNTAAQ